MELFPHARKVKAQGKTAHRRLRDQRKALALGEGGIVEAEVIAGNDDRHFARRRIVAPVFGLHVEEVLGDGFEEHVGRDAETDLEPCGDLELRRREASHLLSEALSLECFDLPGAEAIRPLRPKETATHLLGEDDVVALHEAVLRSEDAHGVLVELAPHEDDRHPHEIRKEEAEELERADMSSEKAEHELIHRRRLELVGEGIVQRKVLPDRGSEDRRPLGAGFVFDETGQSLGISFAEVAYRFVEEQEVKGLGQGTDGGYSLLLSKREQAGRRMELVRYAEGFEVAFERLLVLVPSELIL